MKNELIHQFPHSLARAIRVKKDKTTARVMEFKGRQLEPDQASTLLKGYYGDFLSIAKQKNLIIKKKPDGAFDELQKTAIVQKSI